MVAHALLFAEVSAEKMPVDALISAIHKHRKNAKLRKYHWRDINNRKIQFLRLKGLTFQHHVKHQAAHQVG